MNIQELVGKYVKIRDAKAEITAQHKKELERYNHALDKIEKMLAAEFEELGTDSVRTDAGTAYRSVQTSASVADRDAFFRFVEENKAWNFLESRVNKTAVSEFIAANDDLPPGVNVSRRVVVNIRRS